MPSFTAKLDTRAQEAFLRRYQPNAVLSILEEAAKAGADKAKAVLLQAAPVGKSGHLSQYYRRNALGHGTFRRSIRAAKIRGRRSALGGLQGRTVGYVVGPLGKNAFTRAWIEGGTRGPGRHRVRANAWVERSAGTALGVARVASEAKLVAYARR